MTYKPRTVQALSGFIGLVLLIGIAAVGILAAQGAFADDYTLTATTTRTGFGLDTSSDVKVRGISVGSVTGVELLDDGTVELEISLRKELQVPVSATASIEPVSVFGPKFVDLDLGPDETTGPYLPDGASLGSVVAPTELAETLDSVSTLLEQVEYEKVALILEELSRGLDGLGPELGTTLDATIELVERLQAIEPDLATLLRDTRLVTDTLADRTDELRTITVEGQPLLRSLDARADQLGPLLVGTSELLNRVDDLVATGADDLDSVVIALSDAATVLRAQLTNIPGFLAALDTTVEFFGEQVIVWDIPDGRKGVVQRAVVDISPCGLLAGLPGCDQVGDAP